MPEQLSEIFRIGSLIWSMVHALVIFMLLFKSRYSVRKTWMLVTVFMCPLLLTNVGLLLLLGTEKIAKLIFFTAVIPSLLFFFIIAKHRNARFVFTFCLADTFAMAVIILTSLLDQLLFGGYCIAMMILRLIMFPVMECVIWKRARKRYFQLQDSLRTGWNTFAIITALFYALMILILAKFSLTNIDTHSNVPFVLLILSLMPMMYVNIFKVIIYQEHSFQVTNQRDILAAERAHIEGIIQQNTETEERLRIERHDLRHRLNSIRSMLERGDYEEAVAYINTSMQFFNTASVQRTCQNPILDSVFTSMFAHAKHSSIQIESTLAIPNELPVDATDLSVVVANALENAVHACENLPKEDRVIRCKYVVTPRHMLQISNPYAGTVTFDENGHPTTDRAEHGIGTRSIVAFCDKYGATLDYKVKDGWFHLRIVL